MSAITSIPTPGKRMPSANDSAAIAAARDVSRRHGSGDAAVDALRGVSLALHAGDFVAVMGPSGSGKSTLMHIMAGLDKPTSGSASIGGVALEGLRERELTKLRRDRVGFVFQAYNLLPTLSAAENVALPLRLAGRDVDGDWIAELLDTVGLADRAKHRPSELSGGQQQRVAIARGLLSRPTILFADEPTGNLDSITSEEVLALLRGSVDTYGQTTLMVTHDPAAAAVADRVLFLADGQLVRDLGHSTAHAVLEAMEELAPR
jgi:putative ABC transport system ATP-binding protein